ncbi:D-2-hydroxyacid dehydrogenase [Sporolactobacillus shoreicorticis]|uniref:D-2-hydroxyacid dehydrogenase n=1 Tax=Sporolactobacillus shoreicorticis TaxID=1923877 RepID=A0ABW5S6I1_9BACL
MEKIIFGFDEEFDLPEIDIEALKKEYANRFEFVTLWNEAIPDGVFIEDAVAFIGGPSSELLRKMPSLRWLQLPSAGANHMTQHPDLAREVTLTNSSGVFGVLGAEHTIALLLAFTREIPRYVKQTARRIWNLGNRCLQIDGSTVAIIGYGDIGSEIAHRLKAFGAQILAVKRTAGTIPEDADAVFTMDGLNKVLAVSDFVVNVLPLTKETEHVFNDKRFESMKSGAIFINVGRGGTVDEDALIHVLTSGKLGGAGLDVTGNEPLPENSRLWDLPNVLITSHSLGVGPDKYTKRAALIKRNIEKFSKNEPLEKIVNRNLGY